jgi:hypothetical protein
MARDLLLPVLWIGGWAVMAVSQRKGDCVGDNPTIA